MQQGLTLLEGGFFTDKTGLKIFVFINAMIFAFINFVTNTLLDMIFVKKFAQLDFQAKNFTPVNWVSCDLFTHDL